MKIQLTAKLDRMFGIKWWTKEGIIRRVKRIIGLYMMLPQYIILASCVVVVFVYFLKNYIYTFYIVIIFTLLHTLEHYGKKIYNNNK